MRRRQFLKRLGMGGAAVVVSAVSVSTPILAEPVAGKGIISQLGTEPTFVEGGTLWVEGGNLYYRKNEGVINVILNEQKYWQNTTDIARNKIPRYNDKEL